MKPKSKLLDDAMAVFVGLWFFAFSVGGLLALLWLVAEMIHGGLWVYSDG